MAQLPDRSFRVRDDSVFESLPAEPCINQQDAFDGSVSTGFNLPKSMYFHDQMRWSQNPRSVDYDVLSNDSAFVGFSSDLQSTEVEASHDGANNDYPEAIIDQLALDQVEPSAFNQCSPISGLWPLHLLSHCIRGFS